MVSLSHAVIWKVSLALRRNGSDICLVMKPRKNKWAERKVRKSEEINCLQLQPPPGPSGQARGEETNIGTRYNLQRVLSQVLAIQVNLKSDAVLE